jgi:carotenoid cleavage dioxygenase-like enzyme
MPSTTKTAAATEHPGIEASGIRYLTGAFAPVETEVTSIDLPVEGEIPAAIDGLLVRNGPNPIAADPASYHWFLGEGMLHGIEISGGRALSRRSARSPGAPPTRTSSPTPAGSSPLSR